MKEITYEYYLSSDMRDRLRVKAVRERKIIRGFMVQYEAKINDNWHPVIRYDTSHGFAHRDILHANGAVEKQILWFPSYNIAFTYIIQDLKLLWALYRRSFEEEVRK